MQSKGTTRLIRPFGTLKSSLQSGMRTAGFFKKRYIDFGEREGDIFISTCQKSGTTWMQMILYQFFTDGDIYKLEHITDFSPWFEGPNRKQNRDLKKLLSPRVFKTHLPPRYLPENARFIIVVRDGRDAAVSLYHQWLRFPPNEGSFEQYFRLNFRTGNPLRLDYGILYWFDHTIDWWKRRNQDHVCIVRFEDILAHPEATIQRLARFCCVELSNELLERTAERSSFGSMKNYEEKFDPLLVPYFHGVSKKPFFRKGKRGNWEDYFGPEEEKIFKSEFNKRIASKHPELAEYLGMYTRDKSS